MISLYNNKIVLALHNIAIIAHVYVCSQAVSQNSSKRKHGNWPKKLSKRVMRLALNFIKKIPKKHLAHTRIVRVDTSKRTNLKNFPSQFPR